MPDDHGLRYHNSMFDPPNDLRVVPSLSGRHRPRLLQLYLTRGFELWRMARRRLQRDSIRVSAPDLLFDRTLRVGSFPNANYPQQREARLRVRYVSDGNNLPA